jgi:hypothetical protein
LRYQAILRAALELVAEQGYGAVTMDAIECITDKKLDNEKIRLMTIYRFRLILLDFY